MSRGVAPRVNLLTLLGIVVLVAGAAGALGFLVARSTGPSGTTTVRSSASDYDRGYREGLDVGQAQGIEQGRALQLGASLDPSARTTARAAFEAGYAAGVNDVFGTYDGGWALGRRYIVVLERGANGVAYRIASRQELPSTSPQGR